MSHSRLSDLIDAGKLDQFEARCLEMVESGQVAFDALVEPFDRLARGGKPEQAETLGQMLLDAGAEKAEPAALLPFLAALLSACPANADFRRRTIAAYNAVHADNAVLPALLEASGLTGGQPARRALKVLDTCLPLAVGATFISHMDEQPAIVTLIDTAQALYTLRSGERQRTVGAGELASGYARVDENDFRVLRGLYPERLMALASDDPVKLIVSLLHAHGEAMDADVLREELVPRVVGEKEWGGWFSKTRTKLKRCPNVVIEGRSPVILRYTHQDVTVEDETRVALAEADDAVKWLAIVEGYLKGQRREKQEPDAALLAEIVDKLTASVQADRQRRPADALAAALVLDRLAEQGLPLDDAARKLSKTLLAAAAHPARLIAGLGGNALWERAVDLLIAVRPADATAQIAELVPEAPDGMLDRLAERLAAAGATAELQRHVDAALADPVHHPELIVWMWRVPKQAAGLTLPSTRELLTHILGTLTALGRAQGLSVEEVKTFRARMKSALASRGYERFAACIEDIDQPAAITMRRQIERLDGLGDNAPSDMMRILRERHAALWKVRGPEPWEDPDILWCTAEGLAARKAALDDLVNVKMRENAKAIGAAAEHGNLSENSEYKFALEERDLLRARLAQINEGLAKARVLQRDDVPEDRAGVGSRVTIFDVESGAERVMTFFGPWEGDVERGLYNYQAPVGQKLMGTHVGDRIKVMIDGREREFEVRGLANGFDPAPGRPAA